MVAGLPGMGKTTCLLNLCRQMLDVGIRPIVFSYHQDIDEKLRSIWSVPCGLLISTGWDSIRYR